MYGRRFVKPDASATIQEVPNPKSPTALLVKTKLTRLAIGIFSTWQSTKSALHQRLATMLTSGSHL
jgi:hypothetical protein